MENAKIEKKGGVKIQKNHHMLKKKKKKKESRPDCHRQKTNHWNFYFNKFLLIVIK